MKPKFIYTKLLLALVMLFVFSHLQSQEKSDCRVLLSSISGSYKGECKNGFAHGHGIAKGIDTYEGRFKKGLPHGNGTYTWKNGNIYKGNWKKGKRNGVGTLYSASNGEEVKGLWKDGEFIKEIVDPVYEVLYNRNLTRISFVKEQGGTHDIELVMMRNGVPHRTFNSIQLTGSSGTLTNNPNYIGFENITFPFEGHIRFTAPNLLNSSNNEYELKFKITEEGSWKVSMNF